MEDTIQGLQCVINENNIKIIDSYTVKKKNKMREILIELKSKYSECNTFKRKTHDLISEWIAHNRSYRLHILRSHTKDVDLNYPVKWYMQLIYNIIGIYYDNFTRN